MGPFLEKYPYRPSAYQLREGFCSGFRIPSTAVASGLGGWNLASACAKPKIVTAKLLAEVALGRIAGPFCSSPVEDLRLSPLGLVPKKEPGKFSLIHHFSYQVGKRQNLPGRWGD